MSVLISIIIPVYNSEKYLYQCVDSVLKQTYSNLEVILVDDGSTDLSAQICDEYAAKDNRVKVIHKSNGGVSDSRNCGLNIAKGEYIAFVDSDDYMDLSLCETVMKIFSNYNVQIVSFDYIAFKENGKIVNLSEKIENKVLNKEESIRELLLGNINSYYPNKVFKHHIFDNVRCPVGRIWEDLATTYKLFLKADNIYTLNKKLYFYRQHKNSITKTITEKALVDIFVAKYERYNKIKDIYPDIAELAFDDLALEALKLYDRSLWSEVDKEWLCKAIGFLAENKERLLSNRSKIEFKLYFGFPWIYKRLRLLKHNIVEVVKHINQKTNS
ncbi:MAG: glycosyltransferase family 2 protein [Oscillospiraceae bacterium]|nr:glycosyltransferase family 2 protein [Oscillospiraceae bacterium]